MVRPIIYEDAIQGAKRLVLVTGSLTVEDIPYLVLATLCTEASSKRFRPLGVSMSIQPNFKGGTAGKHLQIACLHIKFQLAFSLVYIHVRHLISSILHCSFHSLLCFTDDLESLSLLRKLLEF